MHLRTRWLLPVRHLRCPCPQRDEAIGLGWKNGTARWRDGAVGWKDGAAGQKHGAIRWRDGAAGQRDESIRWRMEMWGCRMETWGCKMEGWGCRMEGWGSRTEGWDCSSCLPFAEDPTAPFLQVVLLLTSAPPVGKAGPGLCSLLRVSSHLLLSCLISLSPVSLGLETKATEGGVLIFEQDQAQTHKPKSPNSTF